MAFSLRSVLNGLTTDRLRAFAKLLTAERKPTQKDELVRFVEKHLLLNVVRLWNELDTLDKYAISETLHSPDTIFAPEIFKAKYGRLPLGINWTSSHSEPPILEFFLHWHSTYLSIPDEIVSKLKGHVSKPIPFRLNTTSDLPDRYTQKQKRYDSRATSATDRVTIFQEELETNKREMEFAAQQDLQTVLRLTAKEGIKISGKTKRVSESTAKEIAQLLLGGDFYEIISKKVAWEQEIGPIRSFAWPMLLQAAKLAEVSGAKLALTKEGSKALNVPPHLTLRTIWQHLLKTTLFDEFHRIDNIKGQNRRGGGSLSDVVDRRSAIASGLSQLPLSQWVTPAEFSRFMQGTGIHFEVSYNPWALYISDPEYGSLGYDGSHDWAILQGRYIACFLFEYAATLGMIDVAYVSPFDINADYASLWGSDTIPFLSRYDGLVHFRLNALGAYCLGLTDHYEPSEERVRTKVSVMPSLQISVIEETLSPATALLLDTYAEQEAPTVWRLASNKAISAVERGHKIAELREFLESSDEQPLPETVEAFINKTDRGARALRNAGPAILVECESEEIAESIKNATCTKDLCLQADSKLLVVRAAALEKFRKAVNILGYGMPKEAEV